MKSFGTNVQGFLKDVKGVDRIVKERTDKWEKASAVPNEENKFDYIRAVADEIHPLPMQCKITDIRDASKTAKTFRFAPLDGKKLPPFQSGQYANFRFQIGESNVTRPYSISSAPYEARTEDPFFEITVRRNRPYFAPDWMFENLKVGDTVECCLPFSAFYYEPLRDSKNLVALAGGSGIAPFHSLAKEIAYGKLKDSGVKLTILYGSVKSDDIILFNELDAIDKDCDNVKVVHILSDDPDWKGEKGFLNKEMIEKYTMEDDDQGRPCTYMFCGTYPMWTFCKKALEEMGVPERRFRCDVVNNPKDVTQIPGYPVGKETETYKVTVVRGIDETVIDALASEPVVVALEKAAIKVDTHCRNGECGFCRTQLLSGDIFVSPINDGRRAMDKELGWFHVCSAWPLSDLKIKIPIME